MKKKTDCFLLCMYIKKKIIWVVDDRVNRPKPIRDQTYKMTRLNLLFFLESQ